MAEPARTAGSRSGARTAFVPTTLLGLAGSACAAVGAARPWLTARGGSAGVPVSVSVPGGEVAPLTGALALVTLAAWGVVLVTRGTVRRLVAASGGLAALGAIASGILALIGRHRPAMTALRDRGALTQTAVDVTGWAWTCLAGLVVALLALAVAVAYAPRWPSMSSRYDAPGTHATARGEVERAERSAPRSSTDIWKALDDGQDPTVHGSPEDSP